MLKIIKLNIKEEYFSLLVHDVNKISCSNDLIEIENVFWHYGPNNNENVIFDFPLFLPMLRQTTSPKST